MSDTGREGTFFAVEDGARWTCSGRIALDNAQKVLEAANGLPLPKGGVVDLSGLEHADSATLAVLLALRSTDPEWARLRELVSGPLVDDDLHAEALGLIRRSPALAEAREEVVRWAESARAELAPLPAGPVTDALSQMCDVVVDRSV